MVVAFTVADWTWNMNDIFKRGAVDGYVVVLLIPRALGNPEAEGTVSFDCTDLNRHAGLILRRQPSNFRVVTFDLFPEEGMTFRIAY